MTRTIQVAIVALTATIFCLPKTTTAQPAYQPADVGVGETYHLVFVSSTGHAAFNNDIGAYNNFVNGLGSGSSFNDLNTAPVTGMLLSPPFRLQTAAPTRARRSPTRP